MSAFIQEIASSLKLGASQVEVVLQLLDEGATIPFIARYRKDRTGSLDEVVIQTIQDQAKSLQELSDRRDFVIKTIEDQDKMTDDLRNKLLAANSLSEVEDLYLPYKPKRRTRAQVARENGLEDLAKYILTLNSNGDPENEALRFVNDKVKTSDEALQGARDIISEMINENPEVRSEMRKLFEQKSVLTSKLVDPDKKVEAAKYQDYFEYNESVSKMPSHRILAVLRGFLEGFLKIEISPDPQEAITIAEGAVLTSSDHGPLCDQVRKAARDAWMRLLQPSLETEMRNLLKNRADEESIEVFAENLRQLLLSAPLGRKRILAIDPGYRTGCKVVCLDDQGQLLTNDVIYIHEPGKLPEAESKIRKLVNEYKSEAFAIGNGTAGRETEKFIRSLNLNIPIFLVNEDGASIYSASATAREEFPDFDITVRGSVSIGRRLMDPLAELVKIDPKSIGVGQYQHDVNQVRLKEKLDQTVVSCVNQVGVNLNTASRHLLSYVSGIGSSLAENIVKYRSEEGAFQSRSDLLKVPRLGEKAFEQCAGFLRIVGGVNPLDQSAVHPEAYGVVEQIASDLKVDVASLIGNDKLLSGVKAEKYGTEQIGIITVKDILKELCKPGLDPRSELDNFEFAGIYSIEEVKTGMILPGIVTNITRFGAFVDIGVKQDGLVHVSEVSYKYISDPSEVLKLGDRIKVMVLEVDLSRKRISLSIKQASEAPKPKGLPKRKGQDTFVSERRGKKVSSGSESSKPKTMDSALSALLNKYKH